MINETPESTSKTSSRTPQVSIGMPVYNGEPFIRKALDSLLAQTFTDFELIISDNASTDGTEAICREYASRDARICYVRQSENLGVSANFQFVLNEAVGEYFMWAAADDWWDPNWINVLSESLDKDQSASFAMGVPVFVDKKNEKMALDSYSYRPYYIPELKSSSSPLVRLFKFLKNRNDMAIYSLMRKENLLGIKIVGPKIGKLPYDLVYGVIYKLLYAGGGLKREHVQCYKRIHPGQGSSETFLPISAYKIYFNHLYSAFINLRSNPLALAIFIPFLAIYLFASCSAYFIRKTWV